MNAMARARGAVVSARENICTCDSNYHFVSAYEVIFILHLHWLYAVVYVCVRDTLL